MSAQPKRVLVVDDDPEVCRLLLSTFTHAGLLVDAASDGQEALSLASQNRYAVVVLDLLMPVVDGFSVLSALASRMKISAPVVIVLTGAPPEVYSSLDARLVHGIVRKPFDPDELAKLVRSCAEIRSRTAMDAMAIAAAVSSPLMALLSKLP